MNKNDKPTAPPPRPTRTQQRGYQPKPITEGYKPNPKADSAKPPSNPPNQGSGGKK